MPLSTERNTEGETSLSEKNEFGLQPAEMGGAYLTQSPACGWKSLENFGAWGDDQDPKKG